MKLDILKLKSLGGGLYRVYFVGYRGGRKERKEKRERREEERQRQKLPLRKKDRQSKTEIFNV